MDLELDLTPYRNPACMRGLAQTDRRVGERSGCPWAVPNACPRMISATACSGYPRTPVRRALSCADRPETPPRSDRMPYSRAAHGKPSESIFGPGRRFADLARQVKTPKRFLGTRFGVSKSGASPCKALQTLVEVRARALGGYRLALTLELRFEIGDQRFIDKPFGRREGAHRPFQELGAEFVRPG